MALNPQDLVSRSGKVASLPIIYQRLDEAINDPYSNLAGIATILSEDTGLSARLLRIANSALFNFPSKVETVTRAVTIIGIKQLRDLALATSVIELFTDIPEEYVSMEGFWRHSIAAGITARVIATYRREANVERYYIMGLLHDIGRLVMYLQIPILANEAIEHAKSARIPLYRAERELLGFTHSEVGQGLLKEWRLPDALQEAIGYHHQPQLAGRYPEDTAMVHFADILANAFKMGSSGEPAVPPLAPKAWESIGLPSSRLPSITEQVEAQYRDAVEIFLG